MTISSKVITMVMMMSDLILLHGMVLRRQSVLKQGKPDVNNNQVMQYLNSIPLSPFHLFQEFKVANIVEQESFFDSNHFNFDEISVNEPIHHKNQFIQVDQYLDGSCFGEVGRSYGYLLDYCIRFNDDTSYILKAIEETGELIQLGFSNKICEGMPSVAIDIFEILGAGGFNECNNGFMIKFVDEYLTQENLIQASGERGGMIVSVSTKDGCSQNSQYYFYQILPADLCFHGVKVDVAACASTGYFLNRYYEDSKCDSFHMSLVGDESTCNPLDEVETIDGDIIFENAFFEYKCF